MGVKTGCPAHARVDEKEALLQIEDVLALYENKRGSLIQVLHLSQEIYGCLPMSVQQLIATKMGIPLSEVSGVVSFYQHFTAVPRGEHTIRICLGTACYVRGGRRVVEALKEKLGVELGATTEDGKFTLEVVRCIGACGLAPAMMIDKEVFKQVSPNKLDSILARY